uniref:AAA+ ATPase domain-containing protein n=1 Tax=Fagus sylvatica TaxID=28930 RepID=A0A2N9GYY9_FAGSY
MAESLVSALLEQFASIAAREVEEEIRLVVGVGKEVQKLEDNLGTIQEVLEDAEKKQLTDKAVKHWLKKLKDTSYEMDDVLDEWNAAMIKSEIEKEEEKAAKNKVCSFIPSSSCCFRKVKKLGLRYLIARKIKELSGKIDELFNERVKYGLKLNRVKIDELFNERRTTSLVDASDILGRNTYRDDLVSKLLGDGSEGERSPYVISLVGMGGIGKTTLAQLAYNDDKVKDHFMIRMWVCVSQPFDRCRVAKAIIQEVERDSPNITEFETLMQKVHDLVEGKKFFLVLDDVWTEEAKDWDPFKFALNCGAQGSRILVTTRNEGVARMVYSVYKINLEVLSKEDCWSIISKMAFVEKDNKQLEDIGRELANKCKGLPLAAKTLGSLVRDKRSRQEWKNILDSDLWELQDVHKEGYLHSKPNFEMEIIGEEYFEKLVMHSFFQDFEKDDDDDKIIRCKMHDIVHDFAHSMTTNECFTIDSAKELGIDGIGKLSSLRTLEEFRIGGTNDSEGCKLGELKNLNHLKGYLSIKGLGNVIDVQEAKNAELKKKIQLRDLELIFDGENRRVENDELVVNALEPHPELEMLDIEWYKGTMYPNWITYLTKLKRLQLWYCDKLERLPPLGKLPFLESLTIEVSNSLKKVGVEFVGIESNNKKDKGSTSSLVLFPKLKSLWIDTLEEWEEWYGIGGRREEGGGVTIMPCLETLKIWDCPKLKALPNFLETTPLQDLTIDCRISNWMTLTTSPGLKRIHLQQCIDVEHLSFLGKLPFLESLTIRDANSLKKMNLWAIEPNNNKKEEGSTSSSLILFPNLKSLKFGFLEEWEECDGIEGIREEGGGVTIMPRLQELEIWHCPKLKSLPDFLPTTQLKRLEIRYGCPILSQRYKRETGEDWPKISQIPDIQIYD